MLGARVSLFCMGLLAALLVACSDPPSTPEVTRAEMTGEQLAHAFCQTCHLLPEPDAFDKATWVDKVFPLMGPRLGIYHHGNRTYRDYRKESNALAGRPDIFPDAAPLTEAEWQRLMDWYAGAAPDRPLPQDPHAKITIGLERFEVRSPPRIARPAPMATVVRIDPLTGNIYVSNAIANSLSVYGEDFSVLSTLELESPPIDLRFDPRQAPEERGVWLTEIGSLRPTNDATGSIHHMVVRPDASLVESGYPAIDELIRPVFSSFADLDADGQTDIVVSEFGWHIGALSWLRNLGGYRMRKHALLAEPGAISSYAQDLDRDGRPDVIALMAQGNEGIFVFWNEGKGRFRMQQVLKFPPYWGSSSFELADFNGDGFPDVLHTAGDNGDGMRVLKRYHGIRIFLNDGKNEFSQAYFFPLNGAYKAVARDFDADGDLDIAGISFFADYDRTPEEGFVYLENGGDLDFAPSTFEEVSLGRWMVMDVNDWDRDGDDDIALGSFIYGPSKVSDAVKKVWIERGPPFVVLENTSKTRR